jgi:hypothetical protein
MLQRFTSRMALSLLCFLSAAFTMPVESFAQDAVPTTKTYVRLGEDFLHALLCSDPNTSGGRSVWRTTHYPLG